MKTSIEDKAPSNQLVMKPSQCLGARHLQVALMFFCLITEYCVRANMSVAIVAMLDKQNANINFPEYEWSDQVSSLILSSFSWGYVVLQVPAGILAERFGPKKVILVAQIMPAFFALFIPLAAEGGWGYVCAFRFLQGLGQGLIFPATTALFAKWIPAEERATLLTIAYSGGYIGTVLCLPVCGLLATSQLGWPAMFYVFGGLGLVSTALWIVLGSNCPAEDRFISTAERAYIEDRLGTSENKTEVKRPPTPWKSIMTSSAVWAVIIANIGICWGYWTFLTETPMYMKTVLNFDINATGSLSALPYLAMFVVTIPTGFISKFLNERKYLTPRSSRKLFQLITCMAAAAGLIGLSYARDAVTATTLLCVAGGITGPTMYRMSIVFTACMAAAAGLIGLSYARDAVTATTLLCVAVVITGTTMYRMSIVFTACMAAAAGLIGLSYARDAVTATTLLCVAGGITGTAVLGYHINLLDLTPNYAGSIYGVSNGIGNLFALFAPLMVGAFVTDSGSASQWRIVFFVSAGIYIFSGVFYGIFAKAEIQWWNDPPVATGATEAKKTGEVEI